MKTNAAIISILKRDLKEFKKTLALCPPHLSGISNIIAAKIAYAEQLLCEISDNEL